MHRGGEQIGERLQSVICHIAAHRFSLIAVDVGPQSFSPSRLSPPHAAPLVISAAVVAIGSLDYSGSPAAVGTRGQRTLFGGGA